MISIIVPVYNSEKTIVRCVESILNQSYKDIEILLINDGSIDGSLDVCMSYSKQYDNIKVINQKNHGVSYARNVGIKNSSAEFIAFIDSDDYIFDGYLESMILKMSPDIDLVVSGYKSIMHNGVTVERRMMDEMSYGREEFPNLVIKMLSAGIMNQPYCKIFRKNLINKLFDEDLSLGEDLLFVENYIGRCNKIHVIDTCLYGYVCDNGNSLANKYRKDGMKIFERLYRESILFSQNVLGNNSSVNQLFSEKFLNNMINHAETSVCNLADKELRYELANINESITVNRLGYKSLSLLRKKNRYYFLLKYKIFVLFVGEVQLRKAVKKGIFTLKGK